MTEGFVDGDETVIDEAAFEVVFEVVDGVVEVIDATHENNVARIFKNAELLLAEIDDTIVEDYDELETISLASPTSGPEAPTVIDEPPSTVTEVSSPPPAPSLDALLASFAVERHEPSPPLLPLLPPLTALRAAPPPPMPASSTPRSKTLLTSILDAFRRLFRR